MSELPKPGDFPVGSPESRAAARMQLACRSDNRRRITIRTNVAGPENSWIDGHDPSRDYVGDWQDCGDVLVRFVYIADSRATC